MNLIRAILSRIAAEMRAQRTGRQALREIRFSKYRVAQHNRTVQERVMRRMPRSFRMAS